MSPATEPAPGRAYRAPMRSRDRTVATWAGVARGLREDLCGTGGRLGTTPPSWEVAVFMTEEAHGSRVAARLHRFGHVPIGAEVWTRLKDEVFRGVLAGPWHYDDSDDAWTVDLVHVRPCRWEPADDVPPAVAATFARGGLNFQRIRSL